MFWTARGRCYFESNSQTNPLASCKHERVGKEFLLSLDENKQKGNSSKILFLVITMQRTRQKTLSFGAACFT
jgi:hypothetical protein